MDEASLSHEGSPSADLAVSNDPLPIEPQPEEAASTALDNKSLQDETVQTPGM